MPRLQLGRGDLEQLTVRPMLGPLGETLLSLDVLRERRRSPLTAGWERAVRADVAGWASPLLAATPADALLAAWWYGDGRQPVPALLRRYYDVAVRPWWSLILAHLEAERARVGRIMVDHGVGHLLATLHPRVRWQPPYLDVGDVVGGDIDTVVEPVVLGGGSVALVPSVFCIERPRLVPGPAGGSPSYVVIYPTLRSPEDARSLWAGELRPDLRALASLLGQTRARALAAITDTCSTTELAHRVGVSPATASHHADVLRKARLVVSRRVGNATSHRLTALGAALLPAGDDGVCAWGSPITSGGPCR